MTDETLAERPMAREHEWEDPDYGQPFVALPSEADAESWRERSGRELDAFDGVYIAEVSPISAELLRVVAERDEARARPVEILVRRAHLHVHLDQLALANLLIDIAKEISPAHTEAAISAMEEGARREATDAN